MILPEVADEGLRLVLDGLERAVRRVLGLFQEAIPHFARPVVLAFRVRKSQADRRAYRERDRTHGERVGVHHVLEPLFRAHHPRLHTAVRALTDAARVLGHMRGNLTRALREVLCAVADAMDELTSAVADTMGDFTRAVADAMGDLTGVFTGTVRKRSHRFTDVVDGASGLLRQANRTFLDPVSDLLHLVADLGGAVADLMAKPRDPVLSAVKRVT